jgi:peptide/nickel transport system permease protein
MTWSRLVKNPRVWVSGGYLLFLVLVALGATLIAPKDPTFMDGGSRLALPSLKYLLGADEFGRDILSRLIYGARITLEVSTFGVAISSVLGVLLGMVAAFNGKWVEAVIMRTMDAVLCFPPILLALMVVTFMKPTVTNVVLTVGFLYVPRFARIAHSSALAIAQSDYVEAARALGASSWRIIMKAILPNIMAPIFVQVSLSLGNAILLESGLSYLGMGPPPQIPSWGRMIETSSRFMHLNPHAVIWPSVAIAVTVLAFNLLGDAVRDTLDPRLRNT